ncbi:YjcZ family sporulation protein [Gorillibacterium sp. sgz5001074]
MSCGHPVPGYSTGLVLVLYILLVIILSAGFFI